MRMLLQPLILHVGTAISYVTIVQQIQLSPDAEHVE